MRSDRSAEPLVGGQDRSAELLGECDVCRVVRGEARAKLQDADQQGVMAVSDHGKVQVVLERFGGPPTRHRLVQKRTAKPGGNLHIAERRDVRVDVRSTKDVPDGAGAIRTEQIIEERRRVGDDQSQEASRAERSSRIRSAGRLRSFT